MAEENKSMDVDSSDCTNGHAQSSEEKPLVALPVAPATSGKGLPYAPENWPSPGDIWTWKVGKRKCVSGHWLDRAVYPPAHFPNSPGSKSGFHSRLSLEQYIRKEFPDVDVDAFFASFVWKIPAMGGIIREEVNGSKSESAIRHRDCKAGNKMCYLKTKARDSNALVAKSCDICCSEAGFCRDCCCILCSKTVDWAHGGYNVIRCEATVAENFICGHVAHIDCALRAYLAGKVGGNIDLDAQYYCRRCDNKTDLMLHVTGLIKTCESVGSRDDIGKILNLGLRILRGSEQDRAKNLRTRIELIMDKLKQGVFLCDIWREKDNIPAPAAGNMPLLEIGVTVVGAVDKVDIPSNSTDALYSITGIKHFLENDATDEQPQGNSFITSDHSNLSVRLVDEVNGVLQELKNSQEFEYGLAEQKLYAQKDLIINLYQQLEAERSELATSTPLPNGNSNDNLLTNVLSRVDQIKQEEAKLQQMLKIAKGFGETPRSILNEYFGLPVND